MLTVGTRRTSELRRTVMWFRSTKDVEVPAAIIPDGYHSVTARMVVNDVAALVDFLRAVFDATGEVRVGSPVEVRIGDSLVLVSPAGEREVFPAFLYVYVSDADGTYRRALASGAVSLEEPRSTPYGDRRGMVRDPWGNIFQIAHRQAGTHP